MSKLNITFRKEVTVDLNSYYPRFPPALRKGIDDAIYKLLGGQESRKRENGAQPLSTTAGVGQAVIMRRTPKITSRPNSKVHALTSKYRPGGEYMAEEILKESVQGHGMQRDSVLHNLVRDGYFEVVK